MAKTKSELLEEAKKLNLDVTEKNTVAEITAAIKSAAETVAEDVVKTVEEVSKAVEAVAEGEAEAVARSSSPSAVKKLFGLQRLRLNVRLARKPAIPLHRAMQLPISRRGQLLKLVHWQSARARPIRRLPS